MPFQKPGEQGWFYHAPAKTKNAEPVGAPPLSQIPLLVDNAEIPYEPPRGMMFKDTDSKYVRLAKKGGREDLLQFNYGNRGMSDAPVDYPRVDWYYLEDNRAEDNSVKEEKKDYKFLLPEYMVHEEYEDNAVDGNFRPKRAPYGYDRNTIFETDNDPTKKDVKLPEVLRQGYGVRAEKLRHKPVPHNNPPPPKPIKQEEATAIRPYKAMPKYDAKDRADMSKILSYEYNREWQALKTEQESPSQPSWQKKNQTNQRHSAGSKQSDLLSEYQSGFVKREPKAGRRATPKSFVENEDWSPDVASMDGRPPPKTAAQAVKKGTDADKEPFKMTRFKNVPARTDSHRPTALQAGF